MNFLTQPIEIWTEVENIAMQPINYEGHRNIEGVFSANGSDPDEHRGKMRVAGSCNKHRSESLEQGGSGLRNSYVYKFMKYVSTHSHVYTGVF